MRLFYTNQADVTDESTIDGEFLARERVLELANPREDFRLRLADSRFFIHGLQCNRSTAIASSFRWLRYLVRFLCKLSLSVLCRTIELAY